MPANPLNFGSIAVAAFSNILSSALPVIAVAIFGLVVAVASVLFLLTIFGFRIGLSEEFKERVRRNRERKRGKFPFAVRRRVTGRQADAKSPWTEPAAWTDTNLDLLFATEHLDGDLAFFENLEPGFTLQDKLDYEFAEPEAEDERTRLFYYHAKSVSDYWGRSFSHLGSIRNLASASNVDDATKRVIYMHAARLSKMKQQALAENASEWAKQYGDGMASRPVQFVA